MIHWVSNCGGDEHGGASGGQAGDQTTYEYKVKEWGYFHQQVVLRHPDEKVRYLIAHLAVQAADNDAIGYDQGQRSTFWERLREAGYDPSKITIPCETDCSASTAAIVKAVGYLTGDRRLQNVPEWLWTGNERSYLQAAGFEALTGPMYTDSPDRLLPGDIQLAHHEGGRQHTNIYVGTRREGPEPPRKRRKTMECILGIIGKNTLVWYDGTNINDLSTIPDLTAVQKVAKATMGEELPRVDLTEEEFARFCQALKGGYPKHLKAIVDKYPTRSPEA